MQLNVVADQEEKDKHAVRSDVLLRQLQSSTPAQIGTWIDNNVTDLASAKLVLKTLAKAVALLAKKL